MLPDLVTNQRNQSLRKINYLPEDGAGTSPIMIDAKFRNASASMASSRLDIHHRLFNPKPPRLSADSLSLANFWFAGLRSGCADVLIERLQAKVLPEIVLTGR